jgi:hypothetical protein
VARRFVRLTVPAMAGAAVIAAIATEVVVRLTWDDRRGTPGFFVSDPARGARLTEDYDGWFAGVPVHINHLGLRDPREYDLHKGPHTFRILVLGDSVTFGHGSIYEHTYPYLTEQRLRAWRPDIDWQVWNAAVPGYNTSQELAHLLEVGPRFQPDLVVVGFYENDLIDDTPVKQPGLVARGSSVALAFAQRHVYSLEWYKKIYLQLAWRLTASNAYRLRLQNLGSEDSLLTHAADATKLTQQALTPYEQLTDDQVRAVNCVYGEKASSAVVDAMKREPGYRAWLDAVRGFQQLHQQGRYRVVFFLNVVPKTCPDGDVFYNATKFMNDFYVQVMSDHTPAVSCHDAFLHVRPSQMPDADAHSIGNANAVKADVLFMYLRDHVLPDIVPAVPVRRTS